MPRVHSGFLPPCHGAVYIASPVTPTTTPTTRTPHPSKGAVPSAKRIKHGTLMIGHQPRHAPRQIKTLFHSAPLPPPCFHSAINKTNYWIQSQNISSASHPLACPHSCIRFPHALQTSVAAQASSWPLFGPLELLHCRSAAGLSLVLPTDQTPLIVSFRPRIQTRPRAQEVVGSYPDTH